eukprot:SAG22_NODE_13237_length_413_cov_0.885350_1_plen_81_part_01
MPVFAGIIGLLVLYSAVVLVARPVRISNVRPRRTADGGIVNAHDGMFQPSRFPDGRYWLFGTHYQNCTDFSACTFPCGWEN